MLYPAELRARRVRPIPTSQATRPVPKSTAPGVATKWSGDSQRESIVVGAAPYALSRQPGPHMVRIRLT